MRKLRKESATYREKLEFKLQFLEGGSREKDAKIEELSQFLREIQEKVCEKEEKLKEKEEKLEENERKLSEKLAEFKELKEKQEKLREKDEEKFRNLYAELLNLKLEKKSLLANNLKLKDEKKNKEREFSQLLTIFPWKTLQNCRKSRKNCKNLDKISSKSATLC